MADEFMDKAILISLSVGGIHLGLLGLFDYNVFQSLIPQYVKWVYIGLGAMGGWTLYNMFKK